MGTRGFTGVAIDGEVKISYNHWDSYPSGLGLKTLNDLRARLDKGDDLAGKARSLKLVDENDEPDATDLELFKKWGDPSVGGPITNTEIQSYYQLLRNLQGELFQQLDLGIAVDGDGFYLDSLFCEWAYLLDLDAGTFQVYRGFQHKRHDRGRWAGLPTDEDIKAKAEDAQRRFETGEYDEQQRDYFSKTEYHSIALVAEWPLNDLPDDTTFLLETEIAESLEDLDTEQAARLEDMFVAAGGVDPSGKAHMELMRFLVAAGRDPNEVLGLVYNY